MANGGAKREFRMSNGEWRMANEGATGGREESMQPMIVSPR
jgi:hypothetical protein